MLQIHNLHASLAENQKEILKGVSLTVKPGEVHLLTGKNGSGKSSLAAVLSGDPRFNVKQGTIELDGQDVLAMSASDRSLAGLFLANQYPLAIPGINLTQFLRLAYNNRQNRKLPVFKFRKLLQERASLINYPLHLLDRDLNDGFSGGEKKKTEILQMAMLQPKYAILDETDSGLDKQATKDVFMGIVTMRQELAPNLALIVISHYDKVSEYLPPDFVHTMEDGQIVSN